MSINWDAYLRWRPAFAAAMDLRFYTPAWLDAQLAAGRVHLWSSPNAAAITEIRFYPTKAYDVHGLVAAGNIGEVREMLIPQIEHWGRAIGAIGIVIESRSGWARALKASGFTSHQLAIRKEFDGPA